MLNPYSTPKVTTTPETTNKVTAAADEATSLTAARRDTSCYPFSQSLSRRRAINFG